MMIILLVIVRSMVPYIDARFANAGTKDDAWFVYIDAWFIYCSFNKIFWNKILIFRRIYILIVRSIKIVLLTGKK